jgi:hypothetical protein
MDDYYTQEDIAGIMEQLDFTPQQIEANRHHHGQLFLSEDTLEAFDCGFMVGETVCPTTGELLKSQVARDLDSSKDHLIELFDRAEAAFKDRHSDLTERAAMMDFIRFVKCKAEVARLRMEVPVEDDPF